ncbi:hypothetical protein C1637_19120 [Chryseobacterium lactis]|uniref:RHS repeat protein n=1 Tax=Chryseobacterium lactis TaxID=1241981 RepID=A0A3G6RJX8_CHRLC|nr:hypothetical protein [Chryseobacterium lactis]AZA84894.1 hypothetical protein EG342_24630 [Chryseobacterium lactis]AZB05282.1 hypothetical protein EG341_15510 [Chryseobacterium lactis]PNW12265.1 hypothetical protein C1637_19120 [Chryseobacterium lactis]
MKKIFLLSIFILNIGKAQNISNPESNSYTPKDLPSSPTTASLMKFEEIPVDNYTGVPDIGIPITSMSIDRGLNLDVSLKYHPASIAVEEKASDVGLGWNLIAGGTITRTVKGLPDEYKFDGNYTRRGIYRKDEQSYPNKYGEVYDILKNQQFGYDDLVRYDKYNEFAWETYFKSTYDSQYDLYQYNFFGNTGRFIIKRNDNGEFIVKKLDENNLRIQYINNTNFEPVKFTITDENGYVYIFDIIERSDSNDVTFSSGLDGIGSSSITRTISYNSAFHLSRIEDTNNRLLMAASFEEPSKEIVIINNSTNYAFSSGYETTLDDIRMRQCEDQIFPYLNPVNRTSTNQIISYTRKLKEINIIGKAIIKFEFQTGRSDTNLHNPSESRFLKKITVNDPNSHQSKSYVLNQLYRESIYKRMFLSKVDVLDQNNAFLYNYQLSYSDITGNIISQNIGKDYWGYLNARPIYSFSGEYREVTPGITNVDVLSKMTLPTSGSIDFTYENNTYSYSSLYNTTETLTNWDDNINNWDEQYIVSDFNQTDKNKPQKYAFTLQEAADVSFVVENSFGPNPPSDWRYLLYTSPTGIAGETLIAQNSDTESKKTLSLQPGNYYLKYSSMNIGATQPFTSSVNIFYKTKKSIVQKYVFGGGIRIKKVTYKESNSNTAKETEYSYQNLDNTELSSGSLSVPKPIYTYKEYSTKKGLKCVHRSPVGALLGVFGYDYPVYDVITTSNIVPSQKLKGEIGYKNVVVKEIGKGQQNYTYSSPIDIPNNYIPASAPPILFYETPDYKRGLLKKAAILDDQGRILKSSTQEYSYTDHIENIGITYFSSQLSTSAYYPMFKKYGDFLLHIRGCSQHVEPAHSNTQNYVGVKEYFYDDLNVTPPQCAFYGGETPNMVRHHFDNEIIGKANLIKQEDTEFLQGQNSVKTVKNIVYNNLNYPIQQNVIYPDGTSHQTTYQYAGEKGNQKLINANMIGIPLETELKKDSKTISKTETRYDDPATLLPTSTLSFDLQNTGTSTTEVTYDKYDAKGNLQQYTTKDGISTTIIWGYNNTQPIAKIENATLAAINSSFINAIVSASDTDAIAGTNNDETDLLNAFKTFKNNLSGYKITTYSYDPLIGVRSIIPPSGIKESYLYDSAGRLEKVINADGKILKEMKYNYKN